MPGWSDVPGRVAQKETGLPAIIENDANAMAYAEWRFGAGRDRPERDLHDARNGVGGGLDSGRKIIRGSQLGAGEIGQMILQPQAFRAVTVISARWKICWQPADCRARPTGLCRGGNVRPSEELTPLFLEKARASGDEIAAKLWEIIGFEIGVMLTNIVWLLNRTGLLLAGASAKAGPRSSSR